MSEFAGGERRVSLAANSFASATTILWQRELMQFLRRPGRVIAALGQPVLLWLLLGSGLGSAFEFAGENYLVFFFPGMVFLIVLFSTIFSTIAVIEDRQRGFLRAVLASPSSRSAIVLGKLLGSSTLATVQGAVVLLLAPVAGIPLSVIGFATAVALLFLYAMALSALGLALAWRSESTAEYHAAMNFLLLPMWLLSGALFPATKSPFWLAALLSVNPLRYGVDGLRGLLGGVSAGSGAAWIVGAVFFAVAFAICLVVARRRTEVM